MFSLATVSLAEDKSVTPIQQTASELFQADSLESLTPEKQIRSVFSSMVKTYGVKSRLEIANAITALVPAELHGYVAKRALSYSPVKAKELLAGLSQQGSSSVGSALSTLPSSSIHTAATASAAGVSLDSRTFALPQVEARRRVVVTYGGSGGDTLLSAGGLALIPGPNPGDPPVQVQVNSVLGTVSDNGFTKDGMGYTIRDVANNLIGVYLVAKNVGGGNWEFSQKNVVNGDPNPGSGGSKVTINTN